MSYKVKIKVKIIRVNINGMMHALMLTPSLLKCVRVCLQCRDVGHDL